MGVRRSCWYMTVLGTVFKTAKQIHKSDIWMMWMTVFMTGIDKCTVFSRQGGHRCIVIRHSGQTVLWRLKWKCVNLNIGPWIWGNVAWKVLVKCLNRVCENVWEPWWYLDETYQQSHKESALTRLSRGPKQDQKDFHFSITFQSYWPLKLLNDTCHVHPITHTHSYSDGACIRDTSTCSRGSQRFKPATFRLLDDLLYLLSYNAVEAYKGRVRRVSVMTRHSGNRKRRREEVQDIYGKRERKAGRRQEGGGGWRGVRGVKEISQKKRKEKKRKCSEKSGGGWWRRKEINESVPKKDPISNLKTSIHRKKNKKWPGSYCYVWMEQSQS